MSTNKACILVAESDLISISLMEKILHNNNFDFDLVCTITEIDEMLSENDYDLLIFSAIHCVNEKDKMKSLIKKIQEKKLPVLIPLNKQSKNFQIVGFEHCDYLKKPFSAKDFLAKVKSLLR